MTHGDPSRGRQITVPLFVAAISLILLIAVAFADGAAASVRTAATEHGKGERVATVPIAKKPWDKPVSVMSLAPEKVGALADGDRIEATGEVELTICLKPNALHPGSGQPCVGDMYGYNPDLKARLVLAPDAGSSNPSNTMAISKIVGLSCHQNQPVRNHHCVVSIPWSGVGVKADSLPCAPSKCRINMVVSASHGNAGKGDKVVVGSSDDRKRIHQGLAKLSSVRYRPGKTKASKTWRTKRRATSSAPVVNKGHNIKRKVIVSAKVSHLKEGDQLVVDAKARTAIGHLPYNVFHRTEVVLAKTKSSTDQYGKVAASTSRISASNGFNCTRGNSGHSNVCEMRKGGVLTVKKNAKGPFYVNFVVGTGAIGTTSTHAKWKGSHKVKVPKSGSFITVERYKGAGSCSTCSTGWVKFSADKQPKSDKPAKLVKQLSAFGISDGAYNCKSRRDPVQYVCQWRAEGKIGNAPKWSCKAKGWYRKKAGNFKLIVCKEQLGAQLWDQLTKARIAPDFAGACKEQGDGDFKCRWYGEGRSGNAFGKFCKGDGVYDIKKHNWKLDACKPKN